MTVTTHSNRKEVNMKNNRTYMIFTMIMLVTLLAGTAFAGSSADKNGQITGQHETIEGVLSIKEGHGDFLVRLSDGKAQRFSLGLGQDAEITRNGKPALYNALKVNDSIQVQYESPSRKVVAIHATGS